MGPPADHLRIVDGSAGRRHPGALAPVRMSGWSIAAWVLAALGAAARRLVAGAGPASAAALGAQAARRAARRRLPVWPRIGNLHAGDQIANAVRRVWWPLLAVAGVRSRSARRVLLLSVLAARRPVRLADDVAYSLGVWRGIVAERTLAPLVPSITSWPGKSPGAAVPSARVTIRLSVDRERWWHHVTDVAAAIDGLVPVVKGNGYGFGRVGLAIAAIELSPLLAVGTVHELDGLPEGCTPIVLTPTLRPPASTEPVLTVGNRHHVEALAGWSGRVIVKLESSMHRYGGGIDLVEHAQHAGLRTVGVAIHPPLAGSEDDHRDDIVRSAGRDRSEPRRVGQPPVARPPTPRCPATHRYKLRSGSYLWHGDREALRLEADVLDVRPVEAGTPAGYRQVAVPGDGTLVMIGRRLGQRRRRACRWSQPVPLRAPPDGAARAAPHAHVDGVRPRPASRAPPSATGSICNDRSPRPPSTSCDGRDSHAGDSPCRPLAERLVGPDVVRAIAMAGVVTMNFHGYLINDGARHDGGWPYDLFDPCTGPLSTRFAATVRAHRRRRRHADDAVGDRRPAAHRRTAMATRPPRAAAVRLRARLRLHLAGHDPAVLRRHVPAGGR